MFSRSKSTKLNMDSLVSLNLLTKLSLDCHITQPLQIDIGYRISDIYRRQDLTSISVKFHFPRSFKLRFTLFLSQTLHSVFDNEILGNLGLGSCPSFSYRKQLAIVLLSKIRLAAYIARINPLGMANKG